MPTIRSIGPYRLFFYSSDGDEPVHVHVQRDAKLAKFWICPVRMANCKGYSAKELRMIARLLRKEQVRIERHWNEFFGHN